MKKVGIIGAGISGLTCARELKAKGFEVTVLEKSRSYGGRCATRLWNGHVVDHGAQFFTINDPFFRSELENLAGDSLKKLESPVMDFQGRIIPPTGNGRRYLSTGNNRLGKILGQGLEIRFEQRVERIRVEGRHILADDLHFDALVCSVPTPQLADMLVWDKSPVSYARGLTVLFEYQGLKTGLFTDRYALSTQDPDEPLSWSACENHKEGRIKGDASVFVVQASEVFSNEHWDDEPAGYVPLLRGRLEKHWGLEGFAPVNTFAHRWGYAKPVASEPFPALPPGLFVCGDGVVKARIEDVWLSGVRTAGDVVSFLEK